MAQQPLFTTTPKHTGKLQLGMGSCVWAWVDPPSNRTPFDAGFKAKKGWRRAKIFAYGRPFKRVWVKLDRPIGQKDVEDALRICVARTKPKTARAGMSPAEFRRRAGPMGAYQLESCRTDL